MTLSNLHLEILKELVNIGVGKGASMLNKMIGQPIELSTIDVKLLDSGLLADEVYINGIASTVEMRFTGMINGKTNLLFPSDSAVKLIDLVAPGIHVVEEFSQVKKNVLMEIGNVVINGVVGSLSNIFNIHSTFSLPVYEQGTIDKLFGAQSEQRIILARTRFEIQEHHICGSLLIFLEVESYYTLRRLLNESLSKRF